MANVLDELYEKFHDNENFSPEHLAEIFDKNSLLLEHQLVEPQRSERLLEIFRDVVFGLTYTGRYTEAIPYARACLSMFSKSELGEMGEYPTKDVNSARVDLIYALFMIGRRSESLALANDHLRIASHDQRVGQIRNLIRIMNTRIHVKWLWYAAGALLVFEVGGRLVTGHGSLWLSVVGMVAVVSAVIMEHRNKRREQQLRAEVDAIVPPLRKV